MKLVENLVSFTVIAVMLFLFSGCAAFNDVATTNDFQEAAPPYTLDDLIVYEPDEYDDEQEDIEPTLAFFTYRGNIFSLSSNGDIEFIVEAQAAWDLNVWEGHLYFLDVYLEREIAHTAIVRLNLQNRTTEVLKVANLVVSGMSDLTVADGLILYVNLIHSDRYTLYMRTVDDATSRVLFTENDGGRYGHHYQYYDGYIYVYNRLTSGIYRINLDDYEKTLVHRPGPWLYGAPPFVIYDGYIYYMVVREYEMFHRVSLEGGNYEFVVDTPALNDFRFHNGYIYFVSARNIYKSDLDGANVYRLFEVEGNFARIAAVTENYMLVIYYYDTLTLREHRMVLISTDGSMTYRIVEM